MRASQGAAYASLASPVLVAGAITVLLIVFLLALGSRRRGTADVQPLPALGSDVRVLHAQIRALEEALEQEASHVSEPPVDAEAIKDAAVAETLRRFRVTVRGLGARMADDPTAAQVLARIEAAVERAMTPGGSFVRPVLTVARAGVDRGTAELPTPGFPRPRDVAPHIVIEASSAAEIVAEPVHAEPVSESTYAAPVLAAPPEEEVVLPIPAPTLAPATRRGRRWLRVSAA